MMTTVADKFARTLREIGVRFVFGVPSGNMTDYIEALRKEADIDFVLTSHESAAAFMATVCGRLTGIPGVCFGTFGPGATNLLTGVGCAYLDRFPVIAFTDEMPEHLSRRTVQMNIDHQALFQPVTKWTSRANKNNIVETILKAAGIANSGYPGPVHIGMPAGMAQEIAGEPNHPINYLHLEKEMPGNANRMALENATKIFIRSQKPLLVLGLSAVRENIKSRVIKLAEKFQLPVVLTPMAKGLFPENHELYAGVLFHALSGEVVKTCREADLVIGIGYDPVEVNYEDWMPQVPLIHVDGRQADVDRELITNVTDVVVEIDLVVENFLKIEAKPGKWNLAEIQQRKNKMFAQLEPENDRFDPRSVVAGLRKALPDDGILTVDVGAHLHLVGQQWRTPSPDKLLMTNGWSSMGFALPAAIAAKLCRPELAVACLVGDGGFLMMAGEMATAKRLNLKIVFVVINDNSLSLIRIKQGKKNFDASYGTHLGMGSHQPNESIFGVPVFSVATSNEYLKALDDAFAANGPVIIETNVDSSGYNGLVLE